MTGDVRLRMHMRAHARLHIHAHTHFESTQLLYSTVYNATPKLAACRARGGVIKFSPTVNVPIWRAKMVTRYQAIACSLFASINTTLSCTIQSMQIRSYFGKRSVLKVRVNPTFHEFKLYDKVHLYRC